MSFQLSGPHGLESRDFHCAYAWAVSFSKRSFSLVPVVPTSPTGVIVMVLFRASS